MAGAFLGENGNRHCSSTMPTTHLEARSHPLLIQQLSVKIWNQNQNWKGKDCGEKDIPPNFSQVYEMNPFSSSLSWVIALPAALTPGAQETRHRELTGSSLYLGPTPCFPTNPDFPATWPIISLLHSHCSCLNSASEFPRPTPPPSWNKVLSAPWPLRCFHSPPLSQIKFEKHLLSASIRRMPSLSLIYIS